MSSNVCRARPGGRRAGRVGLVRPPQLRRVFPLILFGVVSFVELGTGGRRDLAAEADDVVEQPPHTVLEELINAAVLLFQLCCIAFRCRPRSARRRAAPCSIALYRASNPPVAM